VKFRTAAADAAFLGRFAVEARYPGNHEPVARTDAKRALKIALNIRKAVRGRLPKNILRQPTQEEE
jgi:hypothetical protein